MVLTQQNWIAKDKSKKEIKKKKEKPKKLN